MIDIKELRVGNWLTWVSVPVKYSGTALYGSGQFDMLNNALMPQVEYSEYPFYQVAWENLFPIPLTPEILLAVGFEMIAAYNDRSWFHSYKIKDFYISHCRRNTEEFKENDFLYLSGKNNITISSLHQLQNLYWCLVGKELEYNPKQ